MEVWELKLYCYPSAGGFKKKKKKDNSEKTVGILEDRWWLQKAKLEEEKVSKQLPPKYMETNAMSAQNVGGVSTRSKNGAPPRKGCVVNGPMK